MKPLLDAIRCRCSHAYARVISQKARPCVLNGADKYDLPPSHAGLLARGEKARSLGTATPTMTVTIRLALHCR